MSDMVTFRRKYRRLSSDFSSSHHSRYISRNETRMKLRTKAARRKEGRKEGRLAGRNRSPFRCFLGFGVGLGRFWPKRESILGQETYWRWSRLISIWQFNSSQFQGIDQTLIWKRRTTIAWPRNRYLDADFGGLNGFISLDWLVDRLDLSERRLFLSADLSCYTKWVKLF